MAHILFSGAELGRVDRVCSELDPAIHDLTAPYIDRIDHAVDREFVIRYLRKVLRGELVMGLIARAVAAGAQEKGGIQPKVARQLVVDDLSRQRSALVSDLLGGEVRQWQYNQTYFTEEATRANNILRDANGPCFEDGSHAAQQAMYALLDIANDSMFGSFDEEYANLVERSAFTD